MNVHSTAFLESARVNIAMKCCKHWGGLIVFPSTGSIKELVSEHNVPLEVFEHVWVSALGVAGP